MAPGEAFTIGTHGLQEARKYAVFDALFQGSKIKAFPIIAPRRQPWPLPGAIDNCRGAHVFQSNQRFGLPIEGIGAAR
jgi:hypothetical protein